MENDRQLHSKSYDTVVCGGGPSGWVAAIASARMGQKTALIERMGFLGGAATANLVVPISGFYKNGERVVGGIAWEFIQRMLEQNAAQIEMPKGHISVDIEYYKLIAQRMVLEAGVDIYTSSSLVEAVCEEQRIKEIVILDRGGKSTIKAKTFIDATGDGILCELVNAPLMERESMQPLSLCFVLSHVDTSTELLKHSIHHDGKYGPSCNDVLHNYLDALYQEGKAPVFGGPWFNTLVSGSDIAVNMTRNVVSTLDGQDYSAAELQMREDMFTLVELLRQGFLEFKDCVISNSAVNAGVREGRHFKGIHTFTGEEFRNPQSIKDTVAHAAHPMDIHRTDGSGQILLQTKHSGQVPYGSMVSDEIDNLIVAGRLISADEEAYASIRVQGTCMAVGEAAGVACALSNEHEIPVYAVDYSELREYLISRNAIL